MSVPEPTEQTRSEIGTWLQADTSRLGEVFRYMQEHTDATPTSIADSGASGNSGAAGNVLRNLEVLHTGQMPTSVSAATGTRRRISTMLKTGTFSTETTEYLRALSTALDDVSQDPQLLAEQSRKLQEDSAVLEADANQGLGAVYVYSLPHYLNFPVAGDCTYFKVGFSKGDPLKRVKRQRTTALPEDPVLLRLYRNPDGGSQNMHDFEKKFHKVLVAAGHTVPKNLEGGTEWFLTSLDMLDTLAGVLGMTSWTSDTP